MTKSFSRVMAIILSLVMLIALPVVSGAADAEAEISNVNLTVVSGKWSDDYVGTLRLTFDCDATKAVGSTLITVSRNSERNIIGVVKLEDASVSVSGNTVSVEFDLDRTIEHSDTYIFAVNEGAFTADDGTVNAGYAYSMTGNALIEAIDKEEIAVSPIQQLIVWLKSFNASWLKPIIDILIWFTKL